MIKEVSAEIPKNRKAHRYCFSSMVFIELLLMYLILHMISYLKFEIVIIFRHHLIVSNVDRMRLSFMPRLDVVLISVLQFEFMEGAS